MPRLDDALQTLRSLDALAGADNPLTRRDPRAKLLVTLVFVGVVLSHDRYAVAAMLPMALFPVVLAVQCGVPTRAVVQSLLLAAPFALMVGAFNPWLDREPMFAAGGVVISAGWVSLASIALRLTLTVAAGVVLVAATGMPALCAALARLGVPQVLTVQLLLMHRYMFVLASEAQRMGTAQRLRGGTRRGLPLSTWASLPGHLLLRAFDRAQRVHQAMLARGFDGRLRLGSATRWQWADTTFVLAWCAYFAAVRLLDPPQMLGRMMLGLSP